MVSSDLRILLVVTGGIAAVKTPEIIRRGRESGLSFTCVLTSAARQFVTPLSLSALSGTRTYDDLFSLTDEVEMGHIRLSRSSDLVIVAPASADFIAKMANGIANDLASTAVLATDKPVMIAPAMNHRMWRHPSTQRNIAKLNADGIYIVGPEVGDMACGETGPGRMSEPDVILAAIHSILADRKRLSGRRAVVTSGPTYEPIDPVRFIGNRSSGKQGHAIATALSEAGAAVTLVSGPVALADPNGVEVVHVETAREMQSAVEAALPADIAVCAAAVADWRPARVSDQKVKKIDGGGQPDVELVPNPDILAGLAKRQGDRPQLVIGFAAETENVVVHARAKLARKGCDWLLANHVGAGSTVFGGSQNQITLVDSHGEEVWPDLSKAEVANRLIERIAGAL